MSKSHWTYFFKIEETVLEKSLHLVLTGFLGDLFWSHMLQKYFSSRPQVHTRSVAEPHHFYAAPALDENFAAAPAPAPTLLHIKPEPHRVTAPAPAPTK
jgi:hypothetical protein